MLFILHAYLVELVTNYFTILGCGCLIISSLYFSSLKFLFLFIYSFFNPYSKHLGREMDYPKKNYDFPFKLFS